MTEDDNTKDLTSDLTDRQILLELRQTMGSLVERVTALEHRTNPLPTNYDERFTALEKAVRLTNHKLDELNANILDMKAEHRDLSERVTALEGRPN